MNKLLKDLYDCFYTPPELAATKREIEECHRALIEVLGKPERRLVLKIIDSDCFVIMKQFYIVIHRCSSVQFSSA